MPKKLSDTEKLARWFVETILDEQFDYRLHGRHLKGAKRWVNPGPDPVTGESVIAYPLEEIQSYIIALRDGTTEVTDYQPFSAWARQRGFRSCMIESLDILSLTVRGKGKTILTLLSVTPEPPPVYEADNFAEWVKKHGGRALEQGVWNGLFPWLPDETPGTCERMTLIDLEQIVGAELAQKSLEAWFEAQQAKVPGGEERT